MQDFSKSNLFDRCVRIFTYFGIIWFFFVCLVNYFHQRPLWNDEQCVFESIKVFTPQQMFGQTLLSLQTFPRLYLFFIQKFSEQFDYSVISLRLFSFICMMTAFALWLRLAKREFKNSVDYLTFVLSWTASSMLIYYSSELKQYSMDVMAGAVYLMFIYCKDDIKRKWPSWSYSIFLFSLPVLCLFSYSAFLFSSIILYNLLVDGCRREENWRYVIGYGCALLSVLILSYYFDIRHTTYEVYTEQMLKDYFISFASIGEFFKSFGEGVNNLFSRWLVEHPRSIKKVCLSFMVFGLLYMFYGFFKNFKKDKFTLRSLHTIAFVLFLELLLLGILRKYPFTVPRTSLFFCPIVFFLTIKGIGELRQFNKFIYGTMHALYVIFLIFLSFSLSRFAFIGQSIFHKIL